MNKIKNVIGISLPMLIGLITQMVAYNLCYSLFILIDNDNVDYSLISLISIGATAVVFVVWYWHTLGKPRYSFKKIKDILKIQDAFMIIVIGICIQTGSYIILNLVLPHITWIQQKYNNHMETILDGNLWVTVMLTVILAPIAEECAFRGIVLFYAKKNMPLLFANIIQSILFAFYHMEVVQGIYAFVIGLILGWISIRFKSICPCIIMHMSINIFGLVVGYVITEKSLEHIVLMIITAVVMFIVVGYLLNRLNSKNNHVVQPLL